MKTIFITISDGEVSNNILRSVFFPKLRERARLVLFVPAHKREYYERSISSETVKIEIIPRPTYPWAEEIFSDIFLYSLHSSSILIKIKHSYRSGGTFIAYVIKMILWNLGRFYAFRLLWRKIYSLLPDRSFDEYFRKYKPDLVFAANLISNEDSRLLKAARRFGVKNIGMSKSWDNLTLKTFLGVFPERLLVQTNLMKEDAVTFLDYPAERITVVGFPKFDRYANPSLLEPRDAFLRGFGLDPKKKTILYAGAGDQLAPHDEEILAEFLKAIEKGKISVPVQVIVRPHPKYRYRKEVLTPQDFWVFDRPGKVVGTHEAHVEFEEEDVLHLMNSLAHCDLLIHTASTLGIEAAIFDKPSITIAFDGFQSVHPALSVTRYYGYVHYKRVLAAGGMGMAHNFEELVNLTNEYLLHPELNREGRKKIVEENTYRIDGKAGERVVESILKMVDGK